MIKSRKDYKYYLKCDKIALGIERKIPLPIIDVIWKFERLLRKYEYYKNCSKTIFGKTYLLFLKIHYFKFSRKLGFSIPSNVFGPGLSIAHYGTIVVNGSARVGKNCRIQECVNIGATNGTSKAPKIGDNVFIGTGAKIIGGIEIGDNVCIGAGAVVTKSFGNDITLGGYLLKKFQIITLIVICKNLLKNTNYYRGI